MSSQKFDTTPTPSQSGASAQITCETYTHFTYTLSMCKVKTAFKKDENSSITP